MWKCLQCGTENNDDRDHCWKCSTIKGAYRDERLKEEYQSVNAQLVTSQDKMAQGSLSPGAGLSPEHILVLEKRIVQLENQVQQLEKLARQQQTTITALSDKLPDTSLLSSSFLNRAFTVWGHFAVVQLMVTIPISCLLAIIRALGD